MLFQMHGTQFILSKTVLFIIIYMLVDEFKSKRRKRTGRCSFNPIRAGRPSPSFLHFFYHFSCCCRDCLVWLVTRNLQFWSHLLSNNLSFNGILLKKYTFAWAFSDIYIKGISGTSCLLCSSGGTNVARESRSMTVEYHGWHHKITLLLLCVHRRSYRSRGQCRGHAPLDFVHIQQYRGRKL